MALILMALAEAQGFSSTWLHVCGIVLVASRIIHPLGLRYKQVSTPSRIAGSGATALVSLVFIVVLGRTAFGF